MPRYLAAKLEAEVTHPLLKGEAPSTDIPILVTTPDRVGSVKFWAL